MLIQFGIECRLDGDLGQHLTERVEVFFSLEGFGCLACEGFQFFLVHVAYPYPVGFNNRRFTQFYLQALQKALATYYYYGLVT